MSNDFDAAAFAQSFAQIEVIVGYLSIRFSPLLVSLQMFERLREIRGEQLWRDRYGLVVLDNANLRSLFDMSDNRRITLRNGTAQIQHNRVLCFDRVEEFMNKSRMLSVDTSADGLVRKEDAEMLEAARHTNGDRSICSLELLNVSVTQVSSQNFTIE